MRSDLKTVSDHYSKMQILTASQKKRVVMLHVRCIDLIKAAQMLDSLDRRFLLRKAQNILVQLEAALKDEDSVSHGLYFVYDYTYVLLERGNDDDCQKAIQVFSVISDAFREILNLI